MAATELARAERLDLAEFLETLTSEQWEAASLCEGWRVRDVVAHLIGYDELDAAQLARRFLEGRLWPDRINEVGVHAARDRAPEELVALVRKHATPSGLTAALGGAVALVDSLIHHQDIRRPLGAPREVPAERLRAALPIAMFAPPIRGAWRARGLRVIATDLDWSFGKGPEVRGPGEAVLMTVTGRRAAVAELDGPGVDTLRRRVA